MKMTADDIHPKLRTRAGLPQSDRWSELDDYQRAIINSLINCLAAGQ